MNLQRLLTGDPGRSAWLYLGIGGLSLVKALAVRKDRTRFRRELLDAGLFLAVGLALRKYSTVKSEKREEIRETAPDWLFEALDDDTQTKLASAAMERFGRSDPEPEPEPSIRARARGVLAD